MIDVQSIESVVLTQLQCVKGLYSLTIQNHLYGCYILMEDIAQQVVTLSGTVLSLPNSNYTFDIKKQFSEIGLRYGFLLDTKLNATECISDYESTWLSCFQDLAQSHDLSQVDAIEEALNRVIQQVVPPEDSYFMNAVENGSLSRDWIDRVLRLLQDKSQEVVEEEPISSALTHAHIEKPVLQEKRRVLNTTRRKKVSFVPVPMIAKTRRHTKHT